MSKHSEDEEEYIEVDDPAPDGGYGWVIVFASFMCNLVVDGIAYTFGLFFHYFVNHFGASKGKTALAGSLLSGCYMSCGPIVSALTSRWGCRPVTIAGSVISCIAFLLSAASPDINCLLLSYGVLGGIGFGLIYLPAIVSVGYYFTTKRAFATGIAVCGSGVGAFIFAPLSQLALTYYDWRGALILQAGLSLNCAVFGALMRPLNVEAEAYVDDQEEDDETDETQVLLSNKPAIVHDNTSFELVTTKNNTDAKAVQQETVNRVRVIAARSSKAGNNLVSEATPQQVVSDGVSKVLGPSQKEISGSSTTLENDTLPDLGANKPRSHSITIEITSPNLSTRTRSATGNGRYTGSRAVSDVNPPPMKIILSSNPGFAREPRQRRKSSLGIQSIAVRPICKKDVFYSGTTRSISRKSLSLSAKGLQEVGLVPPNAALLNTSSNKYGDMHRASVISIPTRDVINRVNREKEKSEIQKKPPLGFCGSISEFFTNLFCCPKKKPVKKKKKSDSLCPKLKKIKVPKIMAEMVDFSILREEPSFVLLSLSNVFGFMGYYIPFVYIIQHLTTQVMDPATGMYVSREKAALVLSVIGITNTIGRIIFGWISDKVTDPDKDCPLTALFINNCCLIVAGLSVMAIPFLTSFYSILLGAVIFGSFISAYISLTSIIVVELLGLEKLTNAFGCICMFRGAAAMMGPPLAGTIYDFTGSFDLTFYAAGILLILSSLTSFMIPAQFKAKAI